MKKLLTRMFTGMVLALTLGVMPALAQDTGGAGTGADATDTTADTTGTADTMGGGMGTDDEGGFDPGWIGLAGLLGLAGLMKKDRHDHHTGTTTTTRR